MSALQKVLLGNTALLLILFPAMIGLSYRLDNSCEIARKKLYDERMQQLSALFEACSGDGACIKEISALSEFLQNQDKIRLKKQGCAQ